MKLTAIQNKLLTQFAIDAISNQEEGDDFKYIDNAELAEWLAHDPDDDKEKLPAGIDYLTEAMCQVATNRAKGIELNKLICKMVNDPSFETVTAFTWRIHQLLKDHTISMVKVDLQDRITDIREY